MTTLPEARLRVTFVDGTAGEVHMGSDLAPDAMYDAIRERGVWVLD